MFTLDEQKARVQELTRLVEQTTAHLNAFVGRLSEAKEILAFMEAKTVEAAAPKKAAAKAPVKSKEKKEAPKPELKEVKKAVAAA